MRVTVLCMLSVCVAGGGGVLHSDLMPPPPKDAIDDAIRAVSDPKSPMYIRLMDGTSARIHT
jgi:hypothetical protein